MTDPLAAGTSFVLVDRILDESGVPVVVSDAAHGMRHTAEHLTVEHLARLGHRRIARLAARLLRAEPPRPAEVRDETA